jgi:serine/threonine protein kinase
MNTTSGTPLLSKATVFVQLRTIFRLITMAGDIPIQRTEITLQPPSYVSANYIGFGLYGRIALLRDDPSRVFKFCEPDNQEAVETLEREKKIFTLLGPHPFILQVHWVSDRGLCFEYHPLGSLRAYYLTLPFLPDMATRIRWCQQVAERIAFIHSKGIVHNDIGARNILISSSMDIQICDFGFATHVGEAVLCVPETRYTRHPLGPSHASFLDDIFSIGSLFYEILEGIQPYEDIKSSDVRKRFDSLVLPSFSRQQPSYLARAIGKCWRGEYKSITDLQSDLTLNL